MHSGGVTDTTAHLRAKVSAIGDDVRFAVADNEAMSGPVFFDADPLIGDLIAGATVTGLDPDQRYWWQVEDGGVIDTSQTGRLLTDAVAVGNPMSFTIGLCGDAGLTPSFPGVSGTAVPSRSSNHPVHSVIGSRAESENWAFILHHGDLIYYNLGSGAFGLSASATVAQFRDQWSDVFLQPNIAAMLRACPWVYIWDDHCFGPNDSDSTSPGRDNVCQVYRETVPSYPLQLASTTGAVYHAFMKGRVLFIVLDCRADRVQGSTMLGSAQLTWLEGLLQNTTAEAIVLVSSSPWYGGTTSDTWEGFPSERDDIVEMIGDHGRSGKILLTTADIHAAGYITPEGNPYGGFPILLTAALDATPSGASGSQWDGDWFPARNQYATLRVDDLGDQIVMSSHIWRNRYPIGWHYHNIQVGS